MLSNENIIHYLIAMVSGMIGAVGPFYALKIKVSVWGQKMLDLEENISKRLNTLEERSITVPTCEQCQEQWKARIDGYYFATEKAAAVIRELAATEMMNVKERLDRMREDNMDMKRLLEIISNRQVEWMLKSEEKK